MDERTKAGYESKCQQLRVELKTWETTWAKSNGGKKPGRADIKGNAEIGKLIFSPRWTCQNSGIDNCAARKYKQYQKSRDILDGKVPAPANPESNSPAKKRKSDQTAPSQTPLKRAKHAETPSNERFHDQHLETTPSISRKLFSPAAVTSLGPTPQRDGRVLGLFDLLEERDVRSPSRHHTGQRLQGLVNPQATPRKTTASDVESTPRMGRTPMSASKRQYLNNFMSPLKSRDANVGSKTPSKIHFDTPQFLKRHSLAPVDENGEVSAAVPLRLPRKPLGRGLSEIVAGLRKVEEDKADEDLEALRDMESEELGRPIPKKTATSDEDILVEDSQVQSLPLGGFDDEGMYDSPVEEEKGRDGNPLRVYKKKGQKRTTRKVNIKPTWNKRPTASTGALDSNDEDEDKIPKTQHTELLPAGDDEYDDALDSQSDGEEKKAQKKRRREKRDQGQKEGPVKKAARKVNELAHANFQRLKLRQNGAKGGPGHNSRFRRRR